MSGIGLRRYVNQSFIRLMLYLPSSQGDNSKLSVWQDTPFPLYDEIAELVEGRHATGEASISISTTINPASVSPDEEFPSSISGILAMASESQPRPLSRTSSLHATAPRTPTPTGSKRKMSSPGPDDSAKKKRPVNAVSDVADAMRELASAFTNGTSSGPNTPSWRRIAVSNASKDFMLTNEERVKLILLLRTDVGLVDTYNALTHPDVDDVVRIGVVCAAIEK
jgi:hypothetical protein